MNRSIFFAILVMAIVSALASMRVSTALHEKAEMQRQSAEAVLRWNRSYMALGESELLWKSAVPPAADFADLASVIARTDIEPLVWPQVEKIALESLTTMESLYGYKACLTDGAGGIGFVTGSVSQAFLSITNLSIRKDILFDGISVMPDKQSVQVRFARFCILMRG